MRGLRLVLRGLSDTLENLLPFTLLSLSWWLAAFLILPAPGATIALFAGADPRLGGDLERPDARACLALVRRTLWRGWAIALPLLPVLLVLIYNLWTFGLGESPFAPLVPLWALLLLGTFALALLAFAGAALLDQPATVALRQALVIAGARLPTVLVAIVLIWLLLAAGTALVVPVFLFLPATVAAIANRLLLDALGIPILDPLAPTVERAAEEARSRERSRFGP